MARLDDQFRSPPRHSNSDFNDLGCRLARLLVGHLRFSPHANLVGVYFPVGAGGGGVTTSLCWVQAPSPKAVSSMAMIMIFFRNFNLSRLLSSQVAPVRLGGEPSRSNAFLHFFELTQIGRTG